MIVLHWLVNEFTWAAFPGAEWEGRKSQLFIPSPLFVFDCFLDCFCDWPRIWDVRMGMIDF